MIDWNSSESYILLNPRLLKEEALNIYSRLNKIKLPGHLWLTTSGTTGKYKCAALSKKAILTSAAAVNRFLEITKNDIWLHSLPEFHVGGLGVLARAHLSGSKVVKIDQWNPACFHQLAHAYSVSLSALVPTQLFDLVQQNVKAPSSYRLTVVGGGVVDRQIFEKSWELGWNAVPSYGMTECSSQVATALPGTYNRYQPLDHVTLRTEKDQRLSIKSHALLTGYVFPESSIENLEDPKQEGWFRTEDRGSIENGFLTVLGRKADIIKINGELVNLFFLQKKLDELKNKLAIIQPTTLVPVPNSRSGFHLHLAFEGNCERAQLLKDSYNADVLPFERICHFYFFDVFPRTALGKIISSELSQSL